MEACALSLDSRGDCLIAVKWQGEREKERGGLVRKGTGQDGIEGRKELRGGELYVVYNTSHFIWVGIFCMRISTSSSSFSSSSSPLSLTQPTPPFLPSTPPTPL